MINFSKAALLSLLCLSIFPVSSDFAKAKLKLVVSDPNGAGIGRSRIILHWDQSGSRVGLGSNVGLPEDLPLETNKDGMVLSEVPPGFYDLFVSAMAFSPDCRKVRVQAGESATYNFKLVPDPLVTKELGFFIPDASK